TKSGVQALQGLVLAKDPAQLALEVRVLAGQGLDGTREAVPVRDQLPGHVDGCPQIVQLCAHHWGGDDSMRTPCPDHAALAPGWLGWVGCCPAPVWPRRALTGRTRRPG